MRLPLIIAGVALLVVVALSSMFIVDERKQALVLQFGQVRQVKTEPGLGFKIPFIQDVVMYEGRILSLETSDLEVTPADERRLVVSAFMRWRIDDVVLFRQAVQTEFNAEGRLRGILNASLREVLGSVGSADVLSPERTVLVSRIRDDAREQGLELGVEVIDVRIRRADLPQANLQATYERMKAEREREAKDERARGAERAQEIRATADRQAIELVSDARRESEIIRGKADAQRNKIFAEAFGRDEEFFAFYRSLKAYENALRGENTTLVIAPDTEFFEYLKSNTVGGAPIVLPPETPSPFQDEDGAENGGDDAVDGDAAPEAAVPQSDAPAPSEDAPTDPADQGAELQDGAGADTADAAAGATADEAAAAAEAAAEALVAQPAPGLAPTAAVDAAAGEPATAGAGVASEGATAQD